MSRHQTTIPTAKGTFLMASGVDPPTALMFVQLWGPGTEEDEVPGGPGQEPDGTWLLLDVDVETVDELEAAMSGQTHLSYEEACAAFGTPVPEDPAERRWYNTQGRALLEAERRQLLEDLPPAGQQVADEILAESKEEDQGGDDT